MEMRMNRDNSYEEYEEVESPYASAKSPASSRLRTRKNVFQRPFAAEPSVAPAVFETELTHHRAGELAETEIDYLDEEEEEYEEEVLPVVRKRSTKSTSKKKKSHKNLLPKIGWTVIGLLVLRLICMDRGVWDYFATESEIKNKQNELKSIHTENASLKSEITRIQVDKNYQRQLAKEHLGVIAADEFLILFAGETPEESKDADVI